MFSGFSGQERSIDSILQELESLNRSDAGGNVGLRLPDGSLFDIGSIIGNDGLPTFDPYTSIKDKPALSQIFESGFFDNQILKNVLDNITDPKKIKEISDAAQGYVKTSTGGTINTGIIKDAIKNLPTPDISGQRPPTQTGPATDSPPPQKKVSPPKYEPKRPDETGTRKGGGTTVVTGGGKVPSAPTITVGGGDGGFDILDIFRNLPDIFGGGGNARTPGFNPNAGGNDMDIDDLLKLPVFGGGGSGGSSSSNASNSLGDILTDVVSNFDFGGLIGDLGDTVINNALSADAFKEIGKQQDRDLAFRKDIYDKDVARLDPYNQLGLRNIAGVESAARNNPVKRNIMDGQEEIETDSLVRRMFEDGGLPALEGGNRDLNVPTSARVSVNENNPFDSDDPGLRFLMDEMSEAVEGSAAARGGLLSGDAVEELQDRAAGIGSARARELQSIYSARDGLDLAADDQFFGQELSLAGFLDRMNRQDLDDASRIRSQLFTEDLAGSDFDRETEQIEVQNKLRRNAQLYDQLFNANAQDSSIDTNEFQKLLALVSGGQSAAAGQSSLGQNFSDSIGSILTDKGYLDFTERSDRNDNYLDLISRVFG